MLTRVKQLAAHTLGVLRQGYRIPVRESRAPVRPVYARRACPKYEVVPRISEVVVVFQVPGATFRNTELYWNPDLQTLSLQVNLPGGQNEDWSAVLAFGSEVDGSRAIGVLKEGTLRVRLPRRDVDTLTGLGEVARFEDAGIMTPVCA